MAVTKEGLWVSENTTIGLSHASRIHGRIAHECSVAMANFVLIKMKEGILSQGFGLKKKSYEWQKRSPDPRPLVHSQAYVNGLAVKKLNDGKSSVITGNLLLAKIHEGGTRTIPARPHIRPAIDALNRELGAVIGDGFLRELFSGQ